MQPLPPDLAQGPFTRAAALEAGLSPRAIAGRRFVRLYPRVYRARDHEMTPADWRVAARLALPPHAHLTGISRIQSLGLDVAPYLPVRFVVEGALHLAFDHVFLHRTRELAPYDSDGIAPAGAFLAFCARARTIDALKVGSWLVSEGHTSSAEIEQLALSALWRDGAHEAIWVAPHLLTTSLSLPETEMAAMMSFAGLPAPEVNAPIVVGSTVLRGDLTYREQRAVVEYEGAHHQTDRHQYLTDVDRYALYREHDVAYLLVTKEGLRRPRRVVNQVHRLLVSRGYAGPPPDFGDRWESLFQRLSLQVGPRRNRAVG